MMIDWFKKSLIGQVIIIGCIVATVTGGVVVWFYESIRIPSLNTQLSFFEVKQKDLENQVSSLRGTVKSLSADLINERLEVAKWKASSLAADLVTLNQPAIAAFIRSGCNAFSVDLQR